MSTLRVHRSELFTPPKLRIHRSEAVGTNPPKLRVHRSDVGGAVAVRLLAAAPSTVEPLTVVSLTAALAPGSPTPDTYTWRQVSGPPVSITGGATATARFTAPAAMPPGATVVLGATATRGGTASTEVTTTVTVLPQLDWSRTPGGAWVGAPVVPA